MKKYFSYFAALILAVILFPPAVRAGCVQVANMGANDSYQSCKTSYLKNKSRTIVSTADVFSTSVNSASNVFSLTVGDDADNLVVDLSQSQAKNDIFTDTTVNDIAIVEPAPAAPPAGGSVYQETSDDDSVQVGEDTATETAVDTHVMNATVVDQHTNAATSGFTATILDDFENSIILGGPGAFNSLVKKLIVNRFSYLGL